MRCSFCKSHKGGSWIDYGGYLIFNLCFDCCKELGYVPNNLQNQKKCLFCGKYFSEKGDWQKICTDCWIKTKGKQKAFVEFSSKPIQRKLQQEVLIQ